jgi:hypothetical protein
MACGGTFAVAAQLRGTSHHHILGRVYVPIRFADVHGQEKLTAQYMTPTDYLTEKEPYIQYVNLDFSPKKLAGLCELGLLTITGRLLCTELSKAQEHGGVLCIGPLHISRCITCPVYEWSAFLDHNNLVAILVLQSQSSMFLMRTE